MDRIGEFAAFGTAVFWTGSALVFEGASKRVGALAVNFWKVVGAFILLALAGLVTRGLPFPVDAPARSWLYLSISGLIGFVIADYFLFTAYVLIGSRVTVVFQALTPLFTALFSWLILGETMNPRGVAGMSAVVVGILVLVTARSRAAGAGLAKARSGAVPNREGLALRGYLFAFLSTVFQALGLVTSKLGLGGIEAIPATQIRVFVAIFGFAIQTLVLGRAAQVFVAPLRDPKAVRSLALGSVLGPFLGVGFSLFALQHTDAGTASTLMALTPVLIIPPSILFLRQKVAPLEIVGALIAVSGTALFFLL